MSESGAEIPINKPPSEQGEQDRQTRINQLNSLRKRYTQVRPFVKSTVEEMKQGKKYSSDKRHAIQESAFTTAEKMYPLIMQDALTGLYNRRFFEKEADNILDRARRAGRKTAFLLMDLDGMKYINDKYGHDKGNDMIVGAANELMKEIMESDSAIRLGGDEYVVVLPNSNGEGIEVSERIRKAIESKLPEDIGLKNETGNISATIGVTTDHDNLTASQLLHEADIALYNGKYPKDGRKAKNKSVEYEKGMTRPPKIDKRMINR